MALPKTFTGGERLFAGDLNDNFQDLDTRVNTASSEATNASNLSSGTVAVERLPNIPANKISGDGFPFKIAKGQAFGSNTTSVSITFPAGLFSSAPYWIATCADSGAARIATYAAGTLTSSGVSFNTWSGGSTRNATTIEWMAVSS